MRLLHLDSGARRGSFSRRLSAAFAETWRATAPDAGYTYRDLAAQPVPHIGEDWTRICDTVLRLGITEPERLAEAVTTDAERAAWNVVEPLLNELISADVLLIGTPMYNYSVPSALKAWLDQVTFPKVSLAGRSIVVASARGGSYLPGAPKAPFDHQESYLRDFFAGHFFIEDVTFVHAEWSNALVDPLLGRHVADQEASFAGALARIRALAEEKA
ncbi:FMN-dependent NADH-azoreductase [Actinocorallia longicatena]|uniref:FMN dependent NADH:quinone oxidoreductase n=1 Tax=Actinocorallia longicatena TaxID=111803 RepID=A0ABP6QM52_9ACTN